jgi:predicted aspartyl protease
MSTTEEAMGRVLTEITVESFQDLLDARRGMIPPEKVRSVTIADALVDTGATSLGLPRRVIRELGLEKTGEKRATTAGGLATIFLYGPLRLTIQGRQMPIDAIEVPDETPALVGQIPLEALDFVIDMQKHRLIGNPAHGGEHMLEMY